MNANEKQMNRCLELAKRGIENVSPNPMVGCVIVFRGEIIGEGYHQKYGEAHAEVNAINAVADPTLLAESTLFVTLEPCAHFGLTPPCSDLIVEKQIPKVVIGTIDPFAEVAGKGIEKMRNAGIDVEVGVLENECREINKRFFTFHEKKRPYIMLKWAQTIDGFIDIDRTEREFGAPTWITGNKALLRVHKMRAEEDAIMVGTKTAEKDNPSLTVRHCEGKNPIRVVLDKNLRLTENLNIFDGTVKTIIFNSIKNKKSGNNLFVKIDFDIEIIPQILNKLYKQKILSVIIEGGKQLLESFIDENIWDEAYQFIGNKYFYSGINAPHISGNIIGSEILDSDKLIVYKNQ
ncbi:MAG: bifunctional diaminohydroxyphosphoribosylaminopyrimidine deaminase/5-amino-6-(5-phosphoribosylamino)uracil reductase RibD [Draconibacterium sp.]|nr:bifunctional diaminohydroxyphosphoribosylaminopyrimidine deaminase/5-amino-6-(5-phosphoribosylamino)uracil reductase RibD [Draconibacterium sp.]